MTWYDLWKWEDLFNPFQVIISFVQSASYTQEGVGALWTGIGPNIARNGIINAAELASYDQVKQVMKKTLDCILE